MSVKSKTELQQKASFIFQDLEKQYRPCETIENARQDDDPGAGHKPGNSCQVLPPLSPETHGEDLHGKRIRANVPQEAFTEFESALFTITTPAPGKIENFIKLLQGKLDERLETPPVNKTIEKVF
jgi:hypothetical protein